MCPMRKKVACQTHLVHHYLHLYKAQVPSREIDSFLSKAPSTQHLSRKRRNMKYYSCLAFVGQIKQSIAGAD